MTTRKKLLIGVTALALTAGWSAAATAADQNYTANHTAGATAGGNTSDQDNITNLNENTGNAFESATGIVSEVQNNGANAAITNGNTVSASIATGQPTGSVDYNVMSGQTATQVGGSNVTETAVDDDNVIEDNSFRNASGVISKVQNNGAESAINNGNAVAAAILEGTSGGSKLTVDSSQRAQVSGGDPGNFYSADPSTNDNDIRDNAFENTQGVMSATQNNGPNSALNNGNSVAAIISPAGNVSDTPTYSAISSQDATVNGNNSSNELQNTDTNQIRSQAFSNAKGVGSALQNNGANTAANNGNSVSALVTEGNFDSSPNYDATSESTQEARVDTGSGGTNFAIENESDDTNLITNNAFEESQGVFSALQNNGANSAINNGNTVSAMIAGGAVDKADEFSSESEQDATVRANNGSNTNEEIVSNDSNTINSDAFADPEGIFSAAQNNGANSALNNGNTVSAVVAGSGDVDNNQSFSSGSEQSALVQTPNIASNLNTEVSSDDNNLINGNAFSSAEGVMSALQNNGANTAANNGNTVSALIASSTAGSGSDDFSSESTQTARVDADPDSLNSNSESDSNDWNELSGNAFEDASGVASALQNNGANSALNNGNTVSGFVAFAGGNAGGTGGANQLVAMESAQSARVDANDSGGTADGNLNTESNTILDSNDITGNAFQEAEGVMSALQNNGPNSAINNGNTVAATITDQKTYATNAEFQAESTQTAVVTNDGPGNDGGLNLSHEGRDGNSGNTDTNIIDSNAFGDAKGVMSAGQNNGANSAINNGNTVAAIINDRQAATGSGDSLSATSTQTATVESLTGTPAVDGNKSEEANSPDGNEISGNAFSAAQGVGSAFQNNGANSAINNGNTVSAVISDGEVASRAMMSADSRQIARVTAGDQTRNFDDQGNVSNPDWNGSWPSDESNRITGSAFNGAEGVFSALQNNGPNSALNNGNTVAAFISDGSGVGLEADSALHANQNVNFANLQRATVEADAEGSQNLSQQRGSNDSNEISSNAFQNAKGVISALQNNGGNSAINNGNAVAAVITENDITGAYNGEFLANHSQQALVDAADGTNLSEAGGFTDLLDSDATNNITGNAWSGADGVVSAAQNNGANTAANNGNVVAAFMAHGDVDLADGNFDIDSSQKATVDASSGINNSIETDDSDDVNSIGSSAFNSTQGVGSVLQNNGANSAINNGNTVAAIINDCVGCAGTMTFMATSTQTSMVVAGSATAVSDLTSDNTNTIGGSAFANAAGVFSVTQNNGPNSAISNGNTVSAVIANN